MGGAGEICGVSGALETGEGERVPPPRGPPPPVAISPRSTAWGEPGEEPDTVSHRLHPGYGCSPDIATHGPRPLPGAGEERRRRGWGGGARRVRVSLRRRGWGGGGRRIGIPCAGDCGNHYAPRPGFSPGPRNRHRRNPADYRVSGIQNGSSRSSTNIHSSLHPQSVSARARRSSTSPVSE